MDVSARAKYARYATLGSAEPASPFGIMPTSDPDQTEMVRCEVSSNNIILSTIINIFFLRFDPK